MEYGQEKQKSIVVMGECEYEALGTYHLLNELNCSPIRLISKTEHGALINADAVVINLSSTPLLGWGKNIELIRKVKSIVGLKNVIAISPTKFKELSLLKTICHVIDGEQSLTSIKKELSKAICEEPNVDVFLSGFRCFYDIYIQLAKLSCIDHTTSTFKRSHYYRRSRMIKMLGINQTHDFNLLSISNTSLPLAMVTGKNHIKSP